MMTSRRLVRSPSISVTAPRRLRRGAVFVSGVVGVVDVVEVVGVVDGYLPLWA